MSKEPSLDPELPLFDYPLEPSSDEGGTGADPSKVEGRPGDPSDGQSAEAPAKPAAKPEPLSLFPPEEPRSEKAAEVEDSESAGETGVEPATGGGRRAVIGPATPLDLCLAGLLDFGINLLALLIATVGVMALGVDPLPEGWPALALLVVVFSYLYWVVPLAFWGQTPGMTWRGLIARNADREPLTFGQASRRWLGALLTSAFVGLPWLLALAGSSLSDRLSSSQTLTLR